MKRLQTMSARPGLVAGVGSLLALCGVAMLINAGGCGRGEGNGKEQAVAVAPAPPADPAPPDGADDDERGALVSARALALTPPPARGSGGDTPVDSLLRERQAALGKLPKKVDHWIRLGWAWIRKARATSDPGFYLNADAAARVALSLDAHHPLAHSLRGMVLTNQHRFDDAMALARGILKERPEDVMALGILSDSCLELGKHDCAIDAAQRMVDAKPSLPSYSRVSWLLWLQGDTEAAKKAIRSAYSAGRGQRDVEPEAWVLTEAAHLFWHEGDLEGAQVGYDMALKTFPDYPPALVGNARVALAQGQPDQAAALLEVALKASPSVDTAWLLGEARRAMGDEEGAKTAWAEAEKIGRQTDRRGLAYFYAATAQQKDRALKLATAEYAARPGIYTADVYAWALYRAGRYADARAAIDRALQLGTPDARLLYHAGAIRVMSGDNEEGRALIERALKLNPHFETQGAREARELLNDAS